MHNETRTMNNRAAAPPRGRLLVADDEPFLCDAIATSLRLWASR